MHANINMWKKIVGKLFVVVDELQYSICYFVGCRNHFVEMYSTAFIISTIIDNHRSFMQSKYFAHNNNQCSRIAHQKSKHLPRAWRNERKRFGFIHGNGLNQQKHFGQVARCYGAVICCRCRAETRLILLELVAVVINKWINKISTGGIRNKSNG